MQNLKRLCHTMSPDPVVSASYNELFTRAELEQILANIAIDSERSNLLEYSVVPEHGPSGFLGEYFNLYLKYSEENGKEIKTRLFVKSMPYQNPDMCNFIESCGMLVKEATLYDVLLNELRKLTSTIFCAQCYFIRKDLFVMQNICDLDYEPLQQPIDFMSEAQLNVLLKTLAILHSASIAYEVKQNLNIGEQLKHCLKEMTVAPHVVWYTTGIKAILALVRIHPLYQSAHHQRFITEKLPAILNSVYDMVNPSKKYRNVFCHRDVWGGNIFFDKTQPNEKPVALVDYQLSRYCPPAIDVLMAIYLNTAPHQRRTLKQRLYGVYYEFFVNTLQEEMHITPETQMSREEFEESLVELELFGSLYNCLSATVIRVPRDYLKNMKLQQPTEFYRYTNVERTPGLLKLVHTDDEFREFMFACVEEMMQLVLE